MNPLKNLGLLAWRSPFVFVTVVGLAPLYMVTCRERFLRLLAPAIFSMLPKKAIGEFLVLFRGHWRCFQWFGHTSNK